MNNTFEYNDKRYKTSEAVEAAIMDKFPAVLDDDLPALFDREWSMVKEYQDCPNCKGMGTVIEGKQVDVDRWINEHEVECPDCGGFGELEVE